ncbi:MAG: hypothetical protein HC835_01700 [Oscillatoriales cyanobacterium RM2_1_1]|nr:hypothetical protein [Oscillatoriales cyanobacterium SM2_3_0]NJO44440.1 hypothetical protein [Oscillatoriales cyanobacterium RM2_1_1]
MNTIACSADTSIPAVVDRVLKFRQITALDYQLLKSAILAEPALAEINSSGLNPLFEGLQKGAIWITG